MKKLLSAVTSVAMSASLMAGAFASPVSAAGSNTVSQPINMGGVLDVSANKTAAESVDWSISTVTAAPGQTVTVPVIVSASGLEVAGAQFNVAADAGIKFVSATTGDAYDTKISSETNGNVLFQRDGGVGKVAADDSVLANLAFTIPDDCAEGTYDIKWSSQFVSDAKGFDITDKVKFGNGAIKVDKNAKNGNVEWVLDNVTGAPGETVNVKAYVNDPDSNGLAVSGAQFHVNTESPIEFKSLTEGGAYLAPIAFDTDKQAYMWYESSEKGVVAGNKATILNLSYTIPSDCPEGKYEISWADGFVSDSKGFDVTSKVKFVNGSITVGEGNTQSKGKVTWEIGNKTNVKPGDTVTLDVKVSDKDSAALPVAGAQFVIDAKSPIEYAGTIKSGDAYGTVNAAEGKPNFMINLGTETKAAADGSTIFSITFKVPETTAEGKYDIKWNQVFVSDTKGFDITNNVVLKNGYIVVGESNETEGSAKWVIEKNVAAEAGSKVKLKVISEGASDLAVAGAQFAIVGTKPTEFVSGTGNPYGTKLSSIDGKPNFIFYQEKGVVADKNAELFTLEFDVPAGTPDGVYPVKWSKQYVSDEKGFTITDKVDFVDGSIVVGNPVTTTTTNKSNTENTTTTTLADIPDGALMWQIDTVKIAQPSEDTVVKVGIYVSDSKNAKVGVAGAQFQITNKGPVERVEFKTATGGKAYGPLDENRVEGNVNLRVSGTSDKLTNSFMFQTEDSKNVAAINGKAVAVLEYTVKADCPVGTYPIDFTKGQLFVSDEKGFDITSKIVGLGGAIIVYDANPVTSLTTEATTTSKTDVETTTTSVNSGDETTTSKSDVETTTTTKKTVETTTTSVNSSDETTTSKSGEETTTTTKEAVETTTTTTAKPVETTTTTLANGAIAWVIDQVTAKPGETVSVNVYVKDPNDVKLGIAAAQFTITPAKDGANGATLIGVGDKSAYGADTVKGEDIRFMFWDSEAHTAPDGSVVVELKYQIGADAKAGDKIPLTFDKLFVADEKGFDITDRVIPLDGMITIVDPVVTSSTKEGDVTTATTTKEGDPSTTTTTKEGNPSTSTTTTKENNPSTSTTTTNGGDVKNVVVTTQEPDFPIDDPIHVDVTTTTIAGHIHTYGIVTTVAGNYFSHDNDNKINGDKRGFDPAQVTALEMYEMYEAADGTVKEQKLDVDKSLIHFGSATPEKVYNKRTHEGGKPTIDDFKYEVQVWYGNSPLYNKDGTIVTVTVYIGVKGDANLDNKVNAVDASTVLSYYAEYQGIKSKDKETALSQNDTEGGLKVSSPSDPLDSLSAFLADVDQDEYDATNWSKTKKDRSVNATDASSILSFYAIRQLNKAKPAADAWAEALK